MIITPSTPAEEKDRIIADLMDCNRDVFEQMVIAAVWYHPPLFQRTRPHLCKQANKFRGFDWVDDFTQPLLFAIYRALHDYNTMGAKTAITPDNLRLFLKTYASMGILLSEPEVEMAMSMMVAASAHATDPNNLALVDAALEKWMKTQKQERIMRTALSGGVGSATVLEQLQQVSRDISSSGTKRRFYSMGEVDEDLPPVRRLKTGFLPIDMATGGGPGCRESTLIIAAPGTGKTVTACQLGSGMAMKGSRVLLVSTEGNPQELYPRIAACQCDIPISLIKDGIDRRVLQPDQVVKYDRMMDSLPKERFLILPWSDRENNIASAFDQILEEATHIMGGAPDAVLLDWLGSALGRMSSHDPAIYRSCLKAGANAQVELAAKHDLTTFTFAQANLQQAINKVRVDATVLSENKTLHEGMVNVWGLTCLLDAAANADDGLDNPQFRADQYIYVSKARKDPDRKLPVRRDFLYQRFKHGHGAR